MIYFSNIYISYDIHYHPTNFNFILNLNVDKQKKNQILILMGRLDQLKNQE